MKLITLFLTFFLSLALNAQNILFNKTYDFGAFDSAMGMTPTQDGNYLIGISSNRLLKINPLGDSLWLKALQNQSIFSITEQNDGAILVTGSVVDSTFYSVSLMKISASGDSLWSAKYGTKSGITAKIGLAAMGNIFILGYSDAVVSDSTGVNARMMKIDSSGNLLIEQLYDFNRQNDAFLNMHILSDESVICVGLSNNNGLLAYLDANSDTVYTQLYPNFSRIDDIIPTSDGNYVVVGASNTTPFTQGLIAKITPNGVLLWEKWHSRNNINYDFKRITPIFTDLFLVGGNETDNSNPTSNGATFMVLDVNGDSLWSEKYNFIAGTSIDEMRSALVTPNQGFIFCGSSRISSQRDLWVVRVDSLDCNNFNNGCQTVDISKNNLIRFQSTIYPNPASNWLTIHLKDIKPGNINIEVFDLAGKRMITQTKILTSNLFDINVSSLTNGIYILKLTFADGSSDVFKVSVNR